MVGVPRRPMPLPPASGVWERKSILPFEQDTGSGQLRPAVPGSIQSMLEGLWAPGKALRNEYRLKADQNGHIYYDGMAEDAAALAGSIGLASAPIPKPTNALGMFGGEMAKTADKAALDAAKKLAEKGATKEEIWDATGWFKGADDKWRFEIPDNSTFFKGEGTPKELADRWGGEAGKVYRHPRLWEAYPELASTPFKGMNEGPMGRYTPPQVGDEVGLVQLRNDLPDPRDVFLHEMQHAIQTQEGFGRGASVGEYARGPMFSKEANDLKADLSRSIFGGIAAPPAEVINSIKYGDPAELAQIAKKHGFDSIESAINFLAEQDQMRTPFSQYQRTAGEVEARNVQARKDLTPEQRRAKAPWLTQDVPYNRQIVR